MSTDVEFRLTLTRDPQARAALRQWEADLLAAISRVEQARLRLGAQSIQSLHRMQMQLMAQQQTMQNQNQAAQQMALQRSLAAQAAMWRNHAANIAALMRNANTAGLPPGGGGGAGGGGGGAGGGMAVIGGGSLLRGYLGYQGARAGANFLSESVQSYGNLESQQIQLGVLTGSKSAANDLLKELRLVGQAFGVTLQNLAATSKLMVGFGVDADDSADKLKRFAAITGGNADAMNRLGRAYGQAKGLGKLMAEETNQMIDAGFSPLIAIANRTGETIGEVRARMKDGGVSFDELRESIEAATDAGGKFAGMMDEMQGSVNASIGRMQSAWTEFQQAVGKWFVGNGGLGSGAGGATALAKTGAFIFNHDQETFNSIEAMRGKALVDKGYKSTDKVGNWANVMINGADQWAEQYEPRSKPTENMITETERQQIRVYELTKANAEAAAKVTNEEKKQAKERAAALAAEESAKKALFVGNAQELVQAQKLNDIRLKSAKDELKARKEILDEAKKATVEAQKSLMTAQERFGAMSTEEQNAAINDLLNARRNGVANLSLEQINRIKSIGTKEAEQVAGAALRNRSGAAFGLTNPEDAIAGRQDAIRQEIARLQNSNAARMPVTRKERRDNDARINQLRQEASQFEGVAERARGQYQEQVGVRNSLFTQERRDVQMAERKQLVVEAGVQQSIQFIAKFDQTAQQIATQVMELFNTASNEQMKEVLKIINPIKKQVEAAQMRRQATAQQ